MMEVQYFRGLRSLYNERAHGEGIYFALDTKEIIHNGLSFSGQIPEELSNAVAQAEANRAAIEILNGSGEGSVEKQIKDAINEFATQISDNGTIDTFKELLEFAATNGGEISDLVVRVNNLESKNDALVLRVDSLEKKDEELIVKIEKNESDIANIPNVIDEKIEYAFSWQDVN